MLPETMKMDFFGEALNFIYACFFATVFGLVVDYFIGYEYYTGLGTKPVMAIVQNQYGSRNQCDCRFGNGNDFYFPTVFAAAIWTS
jgi:K(+)-stimulated pyrophosphate-energized sodium pump